MDENDPFALLDQLDKKEETPPVKIEKIETTPGETDQQNNNETISKPTQIKSKTKTKQKPTSPGKPKKYSDEIRFFYKHLFGETTRRDTKAALGIVNLLIDEYNLKRYLEK